MLGASGRPSPGLSGHPLPEGEGLVVGRYPLPPGEGGAKRRVRGVALALLSLTALSWIAFGPIPAIPRVTSPTIVDRNGVVLYEPLGARGERGAWIGDVPVNVARATIAAEDP